MHLFSEFSWFKNINVHLLFLSQDVMTKPMYMISMSFFDDQQTVKCRLELLCKQARLLPPQINHITWLKATQTATFVILIVLLRKCLMLEMHYVINDPAHHC
jgi:hypothetical protein